MSQELKFILNPDDITGYKPIFLSAISQNFMNYTIITSNKGTGGPILLEVLSEINNTEISLLNSFKGKLFRNLLL